MITVLIAGLVATPVSVGLQGLDALDLPLSGLAQEVAWRAGLGTAYGLTAIAAAFALFAGVCVLLSLSQRLARALRCSACSEPAWRCR